MPSKTASPTTTTPKRDEIIEIAGRLFYANGYQATGVKQIIEEAGIAKGTFYTHFESKDELGVAWLRRRQNEIADWLTAIVDSKTTSRERLLALADFLEDFGKKTDFRGCAFLNTLSELPDPKHPMRAEVMVDKENARKLIAQLVDDHFTGATAAARREKATLIYLLFEAALVESQNYRALWPVDAVRKELRRLLKD